MIRQQRINSIVKQFCKHYKSEDFHDVIAYLFCQKYDIINSDKDEKYIARAIINSLITYSQSKEMNYTYNDKIQHIRFGWDQDFEELIAQEAIQGRDILTMCYFDELNGDNFDSLIYGLSEKLKDICRMIVDGYSTQEIAEKYGCTTSNIRKKYAQIRKELKNAV